MHRVGSTLLLTAALTSISFGTVQSLSATTAPQYREQGLRYRAAGQFAEAIAALQKAVDLDPDNLSGRVVLGWTLHLADQDRAAADVLEATVQIAPSHVPALNALGIIYLVNNDLAAATLTHTWAAILKPNNEIAHYNLSLAFQRLQYHDWAINAAQKAIALEPNNPHPVVALAIAYWNQGKLAIAQDTYRQAMNLDARYSSAEFLDHLSDAGFSADQIELTRTLLRSLQK